MELPATFTLAAGFGVDQDYHRFLHVSITQVLETLPRLADCKTFTLQMNPVTRGVSYCQQRKIFTAITGMDAFTLQPAAALR